MISLHTSPLDSPGQGDAGGLNVQLAHLARGLAALGHTVDVFCRREAAGTEPITELCPGALVHQLDVGPPSPIPRTELIDLTEPMADALAAHAGTGYDIVHSHYWISALVAGSVKAWHGVPRVVNLHTVAAEKDARTREGENHEPAIRLTAEQEIVHRDHVIAGSRFEREAIGYFYGVDSTAITVINPGVDTQWFSPARAHLGGTMIPGPYLLTLGRVQPLKGQALALETFIALQRSGRFDSLRLVIAGEPPPGYRDYADELRRAACDSGLGDRVFFLPGESRENAANLLAGAELTLIPSRSETFGLVALESAASGTPVIGQRIGGLRDSVADGISGLLIPCRDPEHWAEAMNALLTDRDALATMSTSARRFALRHTWQEYAAGVEGYYSALLSGQAR